MGLVSLEIENIGKMDHPKAGTFRLESVKLNLVFDPQRLKPYKEKKDNKINILEILRAPFLTFPNNTNYVKLKDLDFSLPRTRENIENIFYTKFQFFEDDDQIRKQKDTFSQLQELRYSKEINNALLDQRHIADFQQQISDTQATIATQMDSLKSLLAQSVSRHQKIDYPAIKEYKDLYTKLQSSLTSAAGGTRSRQRKSKLTKNRTKKNTLSKKNRSLKMIKIQK